MLNSLANQFTWITLTVFRSVIIASKIQESSLSFRFQNLKNNEGYFQTKITKNELLKDVSKIRPLI